MNAGTTSRLTLAFFTLITFVTVNSKPSYAFEIAGANKSKSVADLSVKTIDIEPILERHDVGNALGLAYNPTAKVFYLAHGSDLRGGYIYTLNQKGKLLNEINFEQAYKDDFFPISLSYDQNSGHLFTIACNEITCNSLELSTNGKNIFRENPINIGGGGGIHIRDDGLWQALYGSDTIRHYTRDGIFINDVSVAASFSEEFSGPNGLTSSFTNGFFVLDSLGNRIVEVDEGGNEIAVISLGSLGFPLAIDSDVDTRRIFLQSNNSKIHILSEKVPEPLTIFGSTTALLFGAVFKRLQSKKHSSRSLDESGDRSY